MAGKWRWKTSVRASVAGSSTMRVIPASTCVMPTGSVSSISMTVSCLATSRGSPPTRETVRPSTTTCVFAVAVMVAVVASLRIVRRGVGSPGAGHQAVSSSPSNAEVTERAALAFDDASTPPPSITTPTGVPALG